MTATGVTFARLCVDFLLCLERNHSNSAIDKHVYQSQYFLADFHANILKLETGRLVKAAMCGVNTSGS